MDCGTQTSGGRRRFSKRSLMGNLQLLLLIVAASGLLPCYVCGAAPPWRTGNTQVVEYPLDDDSTLPSLIPLAQSMLSSSSTIGPYAPHLWRNASSLWSVADLMAAAVARFFVRNNSASSIGTWNDDAAGSSPLGYDMVLVDVTSWALCYASDGHSSGEHRIDRGGVCDRFRTRSGPTALAVATVHTATFARRGHGPTNTCRGGDTTPPRRACVVEVTIMEESMQIFHPDEVGDRAKFAGTLASGLLRELVDPQSGGCIRLGGGDGGSLDSAILAGGLRGISLLSVSRRGMGCRAGDTNPAAVRTVDVPSDAPQQPNTCAGAPEAQAACTEAASKAKRPHRMVRLGIATQNVWNFNGDWGVRQMLLARDLLEVPFPIDVLTLQEVRYHSNAPLRSDGGKAQALDIVVALNKAPAATAEQHQQGTLLPTNRGRHAVHSFEFIPAMTYLHLSRFEPPRIEMEGLMNVVLESHSNGQRPLHLDSDNAPLTCAGSGTSVHHIHTARRLLGRDVRDSDDGHQREILCSVLLLVEEGVGCYHPLHNIRVDVCTSHFALGEVAQNRNAQDSIGFMDALRIRQTFSLGDDSIRLPRAGVTVFTGDLNSEPDHAVASLLREDGFHDAWTLCPDDAGRFGKDGQNRDGHTFNTNDETLVKRIDFLYIKDHRGLVPGAALDVAVEACAFMGNQRAEIVEVSSDHLGLAALLRIAL